MLHLVTHKDSLVVVTVAVCLAPSTSARAYWIGTQNGGRGDFYFRAFCVGDSARWASSLARCCFVWFCLAPVLTSQQVGCTQKLEKPELFDHLEQATFFHSNKLTESKRALNEGNLRVFALMTLHFSTTGHLPKHFWQISRNHKWHCYFERF